MGRFLGFLVLVLLQNQAGAQSFVSETAGYNVTTCVAGSDTIVSAPFRRQVVFRGTLASDPVGADSSATLTLEDSPAFSGKDFVTEAHYLGFTGTSAGAGWQFRVISQGALTLGIDLTSGDLAGVAAGDSFEVIPYWTLDSLFPAGSETVHESPGLLVSERGTEILFFDRDSASIHLAPNRKFFRTAGGWKEAVRGFPDAGGEVVPAGASFVIRHPAGVADTRFVSRQWVDPGAKAYSLKTSVEGPRDNHLGSVRPIPVKLQDLDLEPPAFVESASTDPGGPRGRTACVRQYDCGGEPKGFGDLFPGERPLGGERRGAEFSQCRRCGDRCRRRVDDPQGGESRRRRHRVGEHSALLKPARIAQDFSIQEFKMKRFQTVPFKFAFLAAIIAGTCSIPVSARASVTFEFQMGAMPIPGNSLGVLVADTGGDGFTSPQQAAGTALVAGNAMGSGDDRIVAVFPITTGDPFAPGNGFAEFVGPVDYESLGVAEGEALIFYAFPVRSMGEEIRRGESFVSFRTDQSASIVGNMGFTLPEDGGSYVLGVFDPDFGGDTDFAEILPDTPLITVADPVDLIVGKDFELQLGGQEARRSTLSADFLPACTTTV